MKKFTALVMFFVFTYMTVAPASLTWAQESLVLPAPGSMLGLSVTYTPAHLTGMAIHPDNALRFDFFVAQGETPLADNAKKEEYTKLIKYFLASLTVPDNDQWVNLSPYEKDRIIEKKFGQTEMGRDLLAQDYILKQLTASLIYPEARLGQKFWDTVYARAYKEYGTTNIPVNTFNKVWILPSEAAVYESGNTVYIIKSHLKVMLEEDYLSLQHNSLNGRSGMGQMKNQDAAKINNVGSKVVREIVLPALEKEVNEGKNFAQLRQIYNSMILATWYKMALKESFLAKIYADKSKVKGVDQDPKNNQIIYQRYLQAFKKGVFNYIKEDFDTYKQQTIPRKYFSGGFKNNLADGMLARFDAANLPKADDIDGAQLAGNIDKVTVDAAMVNVKKALLPWALAASLASHPASAQSPTNQPSVGTSINRITTLDGYRLEVGDNQWTYINRSLSYGGKGGQTSDEEPVVVQNIGFIDEQNAEVTFAGQKGSVHKVIISSQENLPSVLKKAEAQPTEAARDVDPSTGPKLDSYSTNEGIIEVGTVLLYTPYGINGNGVSAIGSSKRAVVVKMTQNGDNGARVIFDYNDGRSNERLAEGHKDLSNHEMAWGLRFPFAAGASGQTFTAIPGINLKMGDKGEYTPARFSSGKAGGLMPGSVKLDVEIMGDEFSADGTSATLFLIDTENGSAYAVTFEVKDGLPKELKFPNVNPQPSSKSPALELDMLQPPQLNGHEVKAGESLVYSFRRPNNSGNGLRSVTPVPVIVKQVNLQAAILTVGGQFPDDEKGSIYREMSVQFRDISGLLANAPTVTVPTQPTGSEMSITTNDGTIHQGTTILYTKYHIDLNGVNPQGRSRLTQVISVRPNGINGGAEATLQYNDGSTDSINIQTDKSLPRGVQILQTGAAFTPIDIGGVHVTYGMPMFYSLFHSSGGGKSSTSLMANLLRVVKVVGYRVLREGKIEVVMQDAQDGDEYIDTDSSIHQLSLRLRPFALEQKIMPKSSADQAMVNPGGIDLNAANMDFQIKRDGKGMPLPWVMQDMSQLSRIAGIEPVIIKIVPAVSLPLLSELEEQLKA